MIRDQTHFHQDQPIVIMNPNKYTIHDEETQISHSINRADREGSIFSQEEDEEGLKKYEQEHAETADLVPELKVAYLEKKKKRQSSSSSSRRRGPRVEHSSSDEN